MRYADETGALDNQRPMTNTRAKQPFLRDEPLPEPGRATSAAQGTGPSPRLAPLAPRPVPLQPVTPLAAQSTPPAAAHPQAVQQAPQPQVPAPQVPAQPSTPQALPGGVQGSMQAINPGSDLRTMQINPAFTPKYEDEAVGLIRGANLGDFRTVAGPDFAAVRAALQAAGMDIDAAQLGEIARIAGTDVSGAQQLYGEGAAKASGANLRTDFNQVAGGTYDPSGAATETRDLTLQALRNAMTGPDRGQLAADTLALLEERSQPAFDTAVRDVGKKAAAWGRMGSGMVNQDLGTVVDSRERMLDQARRELATQAAGLEMQDRAARANLGLSAGGQFTNEDLANAGMNLNLRNEARGERDFWQGLDAQSVQAALQQAGVLGAFGDRALGVAQTTRRDAESDRAFDAARQSEAAQLAATRAGLRQSSAGMEAGLSGEEYGARVRERDSETAHRQVQAGLDLSKAGMLNGLDDTQFARDLTMRNELRGERDYQSGQSQQALQNRVKSVLLGDQLQNSAQNRWMDNFDALFKTAFSGNNDYANALMAGAGQTGGAGDGANMLQLWMQQQARAGGGAPAAGGQPASDAIPDWIRGFA